MYGVRSLGLLHLYRVLGFSWLQKFSLVYQRYGTQVKQDDSREYATIRPVTSNSEDSGLQFSGGWSPVVEVRLDPARAG